MPIYYGSGSTTKKLKEIYYGDNGTRRKIKEIYYGNNGVRTKVFSAVKPIYLDAVIPYSQVYYTGSDWDCFASGGGIQHDYSDYSGQFKAVYLLDYPIKTGDIIKDSFEALGYDNAELRYYPLIFKSMNDLTILQDDASGFAKGNGSVLKANHSITAKSNGILGIYMQVNTSSAHNYAKAVLLSLSINEVPIYINDTVWKDDRPNWTNINWGKGYADSNNSYTVKSTSSFNVLSGEKIFAQVELYGSGLAESGGSQCSLTLKGECLNSAAVKSANVVSDDYYTLDLTVYANKSGKLEFELFIESPGNVGTEVDLNSFELKIGNKYFIEY